MSNESHCEFSMRITMLQTDSSTDGLRELDMFDVQHFDVNYRAEGDANIVLALPQRHQVLRLPKSKRKNDAERGRQPPEIFYVYKYIESMSKLIGAQYTSPPQLVRVQFTGLSNFVKWLDDARPTKRKSSAASNDLHFEYGLLYPDAALLNASSSGCANTSATFAVEIKPKQGWHVRQLPDDVLKMFGVERGAIDKCRFCSMQFLKANEDKIARVGDFCPLDLFSGDCPRLNKALRCLAASPQNNFRIFKDGRLVYAEGKHTNDVEHIAKELFLDGGNERESGTTANDDFFNLLRQILLEPIDGSTEIEFPNDCVLHRVLDLQQLALETMPSIARMYTTESSLLFDKLARDDNWSFEHLNELCRKVDEAYANDESNIGIEFLENTAGLTHGEMYGIGATALDCSVMLTFQRIDNHNKQFDAANYVGRKVITIDGIKFITKAVVFDLDPKLYPKHFVKYVKRTKQSYEAWAQARPATAPQSSCSSHKQQ